jgi:hypothetical protein
VRARARRLTLALFAALLSAALPAPVAAQPSSRLPVTDTAVTRGGPVIAISPVTYGTFTSAGVTGGAKRTGWGFGFDAGYGMTEKVWLLLGVSRTDLTIESGSAYGLWHVEPLVRLTPTPWRLGGVGIAPFGDIGGGLVRASGERPAIGTVEAVSYSGSFVTVGAGLNVFIRRRWAVTGGAHATFGQFSEFKRENVTQGSLQIGARTTRANLGLSWFPQLGR